VCVVFLSILFTECNTKPKTNEMKNKIVIAHRGASGYLPEHTMESKVMAHNMNVDFIEQDLVLSKDDVPIVIHDIYLDDVTNVAQIYPEKKREDGRYYVIDFTFEELKQLNVYERFNPKTGKQIYPKRFSKKTQNFKLHSLQEEIEVIQDLNRSTGKKIGIYPEIKAPAFHHQEGKDMAKIVLQILEDYGYSTKNDDCILQCFDAKELRRIRKELKSELFLVQLMENPNETLQLKEFAQYADGVGPWYRLFLSETVDNKFTFTSFIKDAHALGLQVHTYTLRADDLKEFDSFTQMLDALLFQANVDGVFTDFPDLAVQFLTAQ
tara:strand:+ start:86587 stop:87555 length:969 start_codon:yes stop_codon:yes gene_type:complete